MTCILDMLLGDQIDERQASDYPLVVRVVVTETDADNDGATDDVTIALSVVDNPPGFANTDFSADILTFFFNSAGPTGQTLTITDKSNPLIAQTSDTTLEGVATFEYAVTTGDQGNSQGGGINQGATFSLVNFDIENLELQNIGIRSQSISSTPALTGSSSQKLRGTLPECPDGTIEGHKYEDTNGLLEGGVIKPVANWEIKLYEDGNVDGDANLNELLATKTTLADGSYKFEELAFGNYKIVETVQDGWGNITATERLVTVDATHEDITAQDFTNYQKVDISGEKKIDTDGVVGGETTPGEGWTINLYKDTGTAGVLDGEAIFKTTATAANGTYSFTNLDPGNYLVAEVQKDGYTNLTPLVVDVSLTTGGVDKTGADFTNALNKGSIEGHKYEDTNGKLAGGTINPVDGWTVTLYKDVNGDNAFTAGTDTQVATDTTDASGVYKFENVAFGNYIVVEESKSGWESLDGVTVLAADVTAAAKDLTGKDFTNYQTVDISGHKYIDGDYNAATTGDRTPGNGWTIQLLTDDGVLGTVDGTDAVIKTTQTASGSYSFTDLDPGTYIVREVQQTGYINLTPLTVAVGATTGGEDKTNIDFTNWQKEDGRAQTPGFWKNWGDKFDQETHGAGELPANITFSSTNGYELFFGVDARGPTTTTSFQQALGAGGGGENAFLRASSAAFANAATNEINYQIDESQIDASFLPTLYAIDTDDDDHIEVAEIKALVSDIYTAGGTWNSTQFGSVASALDAMNNMIHLDSSQIIA